MKNMDAHMLRRDREPERTITNLQDIEGNGSTSQIGLEKVSHRFLSKLEPATTKGVQKKEFLLTLQGGEFHREANPVLE